MNNRKDAMNKLTSCDFLGNISMSTFTKYAVNTFKTCIAMQI